MSKVIDELSQDDFGKSFDTKIFGELKQKMNDQEKSGFIALALQIVGLIAIISLGGLVGLAVLFTTLIAAMIIALSSRKAVKKHQDMLGITNAELKEALAARRKKMK
ncbi:hypothetical protein [Prevotella sp. 10(H)]|uniref:hypothetical protein n=1 Tax=Prevotella sp. 10(H) TaxID=1158294 RepID=UPI0004A703D3|nr:hypothetical protein [Prevotella sp. 10(H)]